MTTYIYEKIKKIGNNKICFVGAVKESKITDIFEKLSYVLEWFSIGALFYLNSHFINSRLFSIFIFICAVYILHTIGIKKKVGTKEEFLQKVEDNLKEQTEFEK